MTQTQEKESKIDEWELTKEEAKKIINVNRGVVHTFYNAQFGLIGGDHSEKSILNDIDNAFMCKKTGRQALNMNHGLVILKEEECKQSDLLFVETKSSFNEKELKRIDTNE